MMHRGRMGTILHHPNIVLFILVWWLCCHRCGYVRVRIRHHFGVYNYRPDSYHPTNHIYMMLMVLFTYTVNLII